MRFIRSYTAYMYCCIGNPLRCIVVKRDYQDGAWTGKDRAQPRGHRRPRARDRRRRRARGGDHSAGRAGVRRHADGAVLARPEQGRTARRDGSVASSTASVSDTTRTGRWDDQVRGVLEALIEALRKHPASAMLTLRRGSPLRGGAGDRRVRPATCFARAGFDVVEAAEIARLALQIAIMLVTQQPGDELEVSGRGT